MGYSYELRSNGEIVGIFLNKEELLFTVEWGIPGQLKCLRHQAPVLEMECRLLPEGSTLATCKEKQYRRRRVFYDPIEIPLTFTKTFGKNTIKGYSDWEPWR